MKKITIFTPAYNRGKLIGQLYESLCAQSNQDFVWMIINDGSTDNTEELVREYIAQNKIQIVYYVQQNSGKHVAHNMGVQMCNTELFFCVDSDDYLTKDAVKTLLETWESIADSKKQHLSGIVAYRGTEDGSIIGTEFPYEGTYSSLKNLYRNGKTGDTALVYRTEVLKKHPFPVFEGEKFLRENLAYDCIDDRYEMFIMRKIIYICKYLEDGLTKNATALEMKSPKGAALYRYHEYLKHEHELYGFRQLAGYLYFSIKAGQFCTAWKKVGIGKGLLSLPLVLLGAIRYHVILNSRS